MIKDVLRSYREFNVNAQKKILLAHRLISFNITLQYIKNNNDNGVFYGVNHSRKISDANFFEIGFEE